MSRQQADRVPSGPSLEEGVRRDLLRGELVDERDRAPAGRTFLVAGRGVEKGDDGIEVPVRRASVGTAELSGALEPVRPCGRLPQQPQDLVGGGTALHQGPRCVQELAQPAGGADREVRLGRVPGCEVVQPLRLRHDLSDELGARSRELVLADLTLVGTQGSTEPSQAGGVEAAQGGQQQRPRDLLVESLRRDRSPQGEQQRSNRRLPSQRELVAGDLDGDAGSTEGALGQRDRAGPGPDEDRHGSPRCAAVEVLAAEDVGHRLQLCRRRGVRRDRDRAGGCPGGWLELPVVAQGARETTGPRQPAGDARVRRPAGRRRPGARHSG